VLDSLYSTGERDKFRTRLERNCQQAGRKSIISHRAMIEVYSSSSQRRHGLASRRPADPELETEFLRKHDDQTGCQPGAGEGAWWPAAPRPTPGSSTRDLRQQHAGGAGGRQALTVPGAGSAWRSIAPASRSKTATAAQGIYFVRYVEPNSAKEPGFIGKLFGATAKESAPIKYRIAVRSAGDTTSVSVLSATGVPEASDNAKRILQVIVDDLK
jgi:outer membrane protein assembly factor BamC